MGCDIDIFISVCLLSISIHAPIVGCDNNEKDGFDSVEISIHAPIVGCDTAPVCTTSSPSAISIHAPIVGCDHLKEKNTVSTFLFQSTHPSWGATELDTLQLSKVIISIHAPIVGCDCWFQLCIEF